MSSSVFFRPSAVSTMPNTMSRWMYEYESRAIAACAAPDSADSRRSATTATMSK